METLEFAHGIYGGMSALRGGAFAAKVGHHSQFQMVGTWLSLVLRRDVETCCI
jgi:hypothetical protein